MYSSKRFLVSFIAILAIGICAAEAGRAKRFLTDTNVARGELKYQVAIRKADYTFICSGALISGRHVLTAATCFKSWNFQPPYTGLMVDIGTIERSTPMGEFHRAKNVTFHPDFNTSLANRTTPMLHDIAVVELFNPASTTKHQAPIDLPSHGTPPGEIGLISGWSRLQGECDKTNIKFPETLQKRNVTIISQDSCNYHAPTLTSVDESQICTFDKNETGICEGDGGRLLVHNKTLIGIASVGVCCSVDYPEVYTGVFQHIDFIKHVMKFY